ncbi:MAG TPA: hypothetical protein VKY22_07050 [Bradyrhizobium sp.]|jgi:hypothetical protein|nr:hypothetical protein [Bradyrhizobium sp.]
MSHHHVTLPPIIYAPEPPKPTATKRRRRVGTEGGGAADAAEETDETGVAAPVYTAAQPQHSRPVEAVERRNASTTGKLSDSTLQTLLAAQEHDGQDAG